MKVTETPITVSLEASYDHEYLKLLNEYFAASERNSRASSIEEKKQLMAIKESMASLCHQNPEKLNTLSSLLTKVREHREKTVVITRSNLLAAELLDELAKDDQLKGALLITSQMSIHEANRINEQFNKLPDSSVLIVTDAVNTGLDLTAANHLVHYDYPARYSELLQRNNRITRSTSHHQEAAVYYFMTSGKIDEFEYRECIKERERVGMKA